VFELLNIIYSSARISFIYEFIRITANFLLTRRFRLYTFVPTLPGLRIQAH
jgi:hypothetical protein